MITALRVLVTAVLCVLLVGFGVCGVQGMAGGLWQIGATQARSWGIVIFVLGAVGLAIAWLCWRGIAGLWRKPPSGE
jgi:hypothetical protein